MPNPLHALADKYLGPHILPRMGREIIGLAQDFWHDGDENPFIRLKNHSPAGKKSSGFAQMLQKTQPRAAAANAAQTGLWHAETSEIRSIMWGEGFAAPGGKLLVEQLLAPLHLDKGAKLLNLTGPHGDGGGELPQIKAAGAKADSLHTVSPHFAPKKLYDAIIAREVFCRLPHRAAAFTTLAATLTPSGQLSFSDYILNAENREKPAISVWRRFATGADPVGLVDMAEAWAKVGFRLETSENMTTDYKREIIAGLKKLVGHLANVQPPDAPTKRALLIELQHCTQCLAAIDEGLEFYRFHGVRL